MMSRPKRIVCYTFGSRGDLNPFLALGRELIRRGHAAVIASTAHYREVIEAEGIEFQPMRPHLDVSDPAVLGPAMHRHLGGRYILSELMLPALDDAYQDSIAAGRGADLLILHPLALAARLWLRKEPRPWVYVVLSPVFLYSIFDAPVIPEIPFGEWVSRRGPRFQRGFLRTLSTIVEPVWRPYRRFERRLGLPAAPNPALWGPSPHLNLGLFSATLARPQPDWPVHTHLTGFPRYPDIEEPTEGLARFFADGPPPIVFSLGFSAVGAAGNFFEQSALAAHKLGRRALLLAGGHAVSPSLRNLPEGIIAVPYAPHSAVFPQACAIVHAAGIGTIGEVLRAGKPSLTVPFSHDQFDNAARLCRLGVARTLSRGRYTADRVSETLAGLLQDDQFSLRAAHAATAVRAENGVRTACDLIERQLGILR